MTVNDAREFQTETLPKNGRDALEIIVCYGGAKPTDKHLASTVHCVDDEIIGDCAAWIETIPDGRYCLRDLMENLCALNGRSLPRQSQFI